MQPIGLPTIERVQRLLQNWRAVDMPATLRHLRVYALLLRVLADLLPASSHHHHIDSPAQLWWELETKLRRQLDQSISLPLLAKLSGRSPRHITRACYVATGMPPMKRIKRIRLSYARGLVQFSSMSITEIALRLGYTRVQEFSRDYHFLFGCTPSQDRRKGPDYRD